jgi:NAD(P)-dependent dehydrogenase (short-subunit alcohol dehydrogenase family)
VEKFNFEPMETVLITGANRGIGLALTEALSRNGYVVIAGCRHPEAAEHLQRLAATQTGLVDVVLLDVNSDELVAAAAASVEKVRSRLDVIVNNAGLMPEEGSESIANLPLAHLRSAFETNVIGCVRVIRAFLPLLRGSDRPRILNVSSGLGSISTRDDASYYAYATSKAALNMLTRSIAFELGSEGITTVAISPGWVRTDMGGLDATLSPEESAHSLVHAIQTLGPELNGQFLERGGKPGVYAW